MGSNQARAVDTITSNEEHVRMMIYDGKLTPNDALAELLRIERAQHDSERARHSRTIDELCAAQKTIRELQGI